MSKITMDLTIPEEGGAATEPRFLPAQQLLERPEITAIQGKIDRLTIYTQEERMFAVESRTLVSKLGKALEAKRKEALAPHKKETDAINAWFKERTEKVDRWLEHLDRELSADRRRQEEAARKQREEQEAAERKAQEEARAKAAEAAASIEEDLGASFSNLDAVMPPEAPRTPDVVAQEPAKTIRTASGGVSVRKNWTWEIQEGLTEEQALALIPVAFHSINRGEITRAVQSGSRDIPGLHIYQKEVNADL